MFHYKYSKELILSVFSQRSKSIFRDENVFKEELIFFQYLNDIKHISVYLYRYF